MIRVIKHGNIVKFTKTCPDCGCEFEYEASDLVVDYGICLTSYPPQYRRYIKCPECGKRIFHDTISDSISYPNVIYTNDKTFDWIDCSNCPNRPDLNKPITVGDSPCTYCKKMQPYCVSNAKEE